MFPKANSLLLILSFLLLFSSLFAQKDPPYQLSKTDAWLTAASFFTGVGSQLWLNNRPGFTAGELASLPSPDGINGIDRSTVGRYNPIISRNSYYTFALGGVAAAGTAIIPLAENKKAGWKQVGTLLVLAAENNLITLTGTNLAKGGVLRTRPFVFSEEAPLTDKMEPDARYAFFSGHTSLTAANSIFAAAVFSDYYPESKLKPFVWGAAIALPTLVASQRIRSGKHYPTDTAVGFLFGAACGYLVPRLHKRQPEAGMKVGQTLRPRHISPVWGQGARGIALQWQF